MAGITSTKKIKGQPHLLAYITPNEVEKLKALGGQETMTPEGIPAYPEYDNYGYSSQADFDAGDRSKSNDPNVQRDSTFETYRGNKNIGVDNYLKSKYGKTEKDKDEAKTALDKGNYYSSGPNQNPFEKFNTYNTNFQRRQNIKLAQKRAFDLAKRLEKYVHGDFDMDYDFTQDIYGNKIDKGLETLISNKGTSIESTRPNLNIVNPTTNYSILQALLSKTRPDTQVTLENTRNLMRDYNLLAMDPNISREKLEALANRGKTPDQINPPREGEGRQQVYIPPLPFEQVLPEDEAAEAQKEFAYRFGDTQNVGADVTRASYIFNQGGRVPAAGGGIMNLEPRQGYFLGKIVKGVGKAIGSVADAAGKVLKSDLGKMALAAGAFYYGGGGGNPFTAAGRSGFSVGNFFSKANPLLFTNNKLSLGKLALASGALPYLMGDPKPNEDIGMTDRGGRLLDSQGNEVLPAQLRAEVREAYESGDTDKIAAINDYYNFLPGLNAVRLPDITPYLPYPNYATGGRVAAQEGGLMDLGGMEKDYRNTGGFVDIGAQEKADDVPARLSVNEFVMTADAVRNAGGGDIDKGAEVMENMMKNLENGGRVSEESQGNTGAQEMFSVSERIGEVI